MVKDIHGNKIKVGDLVKHTTTNSMFRAYPNKDDKIFFWGAKIGKRYCHSSYLDRINSQMVEKVEK